jgi:hypothetical protein
MSVACAGMAKNSDDIANEIADTNLKILILVSLGV